MYLFGRLNAAELKETALITILEQLFEFSGRRQSIKYSIVAREGAGLIPDDGT